MVYRLCLMLAPILAIVLSGAALPATPGSRWPTTMVEVRRDVRIPLHDGVRLASTAYLPRGAEPRPCVFTLTPYVGATYHDRGMWFAAHGLPFLTVDVRGRGDSEGTFTPNLQEAGDANEIVEWLARQPFCNGKISMWGGSYAGYDQWAAAGRLPPHLATIVPVAAPRIGVDFPVSRGMIDPYARQWLALVAGRTSQAALFGDAALWSGIARERFERGGANAETVGLFGITQPVLSSWFAHREDADWWARYNPAPAALARLNIPILTITGSYDDDQPGALANYRAHLAAAPGAADRHYLVIGPWDHPGTRTPQLSYGGITAGPASLVDLPRLHLDWYRWTMAGGPRPAFLRDRVAYYLLGADEWRYAPRLDAVTAEARPLALTSDGVAGDVFATGRLGGTAAAVSDSYRYDPRNTGLAALEAVVDPLDASDQRLVLARSGEQLVYTSAPFAATTDLAGSFRLTAWIAIDQPDTTLRATVYAIAPDGRVTRLSSDRIRARYREGDFSPRFVVPGRALRYEFDRFPFYARRLESGSRLRLVIDPMNSMFAEKNYNSGGRPELETMADARTVTVTLLHDRAHPSTLYLPIAR